METAILSIADEMLKVLLKYEMESIGKKT